MVKPLVDSDVLLYEIGFSSEKTEKTEDGYIVTPSSWDFCQELFDKKINLICDEVGAKEAPLLFLTNTKRINNILNKQRKRNDEPSKSFVDNFRYELAKEKEYKSGRSSVKPFHFNNLVSYVIGAYDVHVNEDGLEADDAMCIQQYTHWKVGDKDKTIICSRDKDVRQCPGWHYSWECGKQKSIGPIMTDELGFLKQEEKKTWGMGNKFFYYQLLVGDQVDNIGGLKGKGPAFAYKLLFDCKSEKECYEKVKEVYEQNWKEVWEEKLTEQANLLWMIRELDEKGNKVLWKIP